MNKDQDYFSLTNPAFYNIIEKTISNWKFSLASNKADTDSYKSLSKSIDFRKNASGFPDFKTFGMQSVNFENLQFKHQQEGIEFFQKISHQLLR